MSDYRTFYEKLLGRPLPPGGPELSIQCFHHPDEHNSCSLNIDTGLWFCHAHGVGGDAAKAYAIVHGVSAKQAKRSIAKEDFPAPRARDRERMEMPPIRQPVIDEYREALRSDNDARSEAFTRFGWSEETIDRFEIGKHGRSGRYTIPVRDDSGEARNVRMYDPNAPGPNKLISWKKGYGDARLYPLESLGAQRIYLTEGEKDTILLSQLIRTNREEDAAAITGTGGAGTWNDSWTERFRDKDIVIVYDRDEAGRSNAQRIAVTLHQVARSVRVVDLDITEPDDADVTDYFVRHSRGWDDFRRLVDQTQPFTPGVQRRPEVVNRDGTIYTPHLSNASSREYIHRRLRLKVIIAGKELSPYVVPERVVFSCNMSAGGLCNGCSMKAAAGLIDYTFERDDPNLIHMVKVPCHERDSFLRKLRGVKRRCEIVEQRIESFHNIEEVTFVPEIDFSDQHTEYVSRTAYVVAHGIKTNQGYVAQATSVDHPKTAQVVHFVPKIEQSQDSIDEFDMDDAKSEMLRVFQPGEGQSVADKMHEIARDLSANITRIHGREDLIKAIDICYHTVLGFSFRGVPVAKAWGDILIIGDTRTGKTETLQALIRHYRLGEMTIGENASFAGIVGGLRQEAGRRLSIAWGKIPLNDRRLLAIDETSGLTMEIISSLSGVRSNGIAEITKIDSQRTMARTRLIFISNPREEKMMSGYNYGIDAVLPLIGRPEDIARFDFVIGSMVDDVAIEHINNARHDHVPHVYTSDLCRNLVLWAWSRSPEQVTFTPDAEQTCLDLAVYQSKRYSPRKVPLIQGGNHRIRLAKMAVAVACRQFSTDDGETVVVKPEHVQYASQFLEECYTKDSLDYLRQSESINKNEYIDQSVADEVNKWIDQHPDWADYWMENDQLRLDDLKTVFDLETAEVRAHQFKPLTKWKMVVKSRSYGTYEKTAQFIRLLKRGKIARQKKIANTNGAAPAAAVEQKTEKKKDEVMTSEDFPF